MDTVLLDIAANGGLRTPAPAPKPPPDPGDQHLWDLLAVEPGTVLVAGDGELLERPPAFARLLTPAAFARLWGLA
ncbi:hypothetical protein [Deferrisoma camini]|uniref:hypothetical protein n=1 Tax=Deferrisoma camini TaxID=1035120 RepID=UPI00146E7899|nr:hypothetical protein [Deferrisoma camini]